MGVAAGVFGDGWGGVVYEIQSGGGNSLWMIYFMEFQNILIIF